MSDEKEKGLSQPLLVLATMVKLSRPSITAIATELGISEAAAKRAMVNLRDHWGVKWRFNRTVRAVDGGLGSYVIDDIGPFDEVRVVRLVTRRSKSS